MCLSALFAGSGKKRKSAGSSSNEKRRSEPRDQRRYEKIPVVAEVAERKWAERPDMKRSKDIHSRLDHHTRPQYSYTQNSGASRRPTLAVNVPPMWHRRAGSTSSNSSEEMLLNPRPDRPAANDRRHRHAKHTSQSTLRGRGAKRQRTTDSRDDHISSHSSPKTPKKKAPSRTVENSSRSNRSSRQHQYHAHPSEPQPSPSRSRRHHSQVSHHHSARANTAARRDPSDDRRFAVLAATNTALEHLRREAFAQPSPPPPPRLRRYQGVQIPASSVPFAWDCISSQTHSSARHDEGSSRQRRRR
ncbi:hypothetical protein DPSP01_001426 [Paraphaeosphaeria sporulosa]|uniref:Uncharacterized protein n=1 Tax=Paraphaeosphaeria sporulosa TaxID=1460663 RepID=A0A177CJ33_9PLEO|nr:uncharacterized protein CC84DRAFT_629738 [Paraphaeosphaeria sporulosa]OAG06868.1 hypothetical protein CC84DRAFT_629738 [Paraphaeosphaeria sporulosa]